MVSRTARRMRLLELLPGARARTPVQAVHHMPEVRLDRVQVRDETRERPDDVRVAARANEHRDRRDDALGVCDGRLRDAV